jgi:hypothetical protein
MMYVGESDPRLLEKAQQLRHRPPETFGDPSALSVAQPDPE